MNDIDTRRVALEEAQRTARQVGNMLPMRGGGMSVPEGKTTTPGGGAAYDGPFEMSVSGTTATFTNCVAQRQMYFIVAADKTCTVTLTGDCYIGYVLTEADNSIAMATGAAFTDVAYTSIPADQSTFKVPLYKLTNGAVVCDYRKIPQPGAWA